MIINGIVIKDNFMYETIKDIASESNITDSNIIANAYKELYNKTSAKGKSWNCKMIDDILNRK